MPFRILEIEPEFGALATALERLEIEHEIVSVVCDSEDSFEVYRQNHHPLFCEWVTTDDWNPDCYCPGCRQLIKFAGGEGDWTPGGGSVCPKCSNEAGWIPVEQAVDCVTIGALALKNKTKAEKILDIIIACHPKYVIWLTDKFVVADEPEDSVFTYITRSLQRLGYYNSVQCLNSKYFGGVEDHEYTAMVSILNSREFQFPHGWVQRWQLIDYLEENDFKLNDTYLKSVKGDKFLVSSKAKSTDEERYCSRLLGKYVTNSKDYAVYDMFGLAPALRTDNWKTTLLLDEEHRLRNFTIGEMLSFKGYDSDWADCILLKNNVEEHIAATPSTDVMRAIADRLFRYCVTFTGRDREAKQGLLEYLLKDTDERLWQAITNFGRQERLIGNYLLTADEPDGSVGLQDLWNQEADHIYHK